MTAFLRRWRLFIATAALVQLTSSAASAGVLPWWFALVLMLFLIVIVDPGKRR
jgi:hypothetical protein